jgi:hypothetical protein
MNVAAKERAERRKVAGGIADDAGHITTAEEQFEEVELIAGRKGRRQEIEQWLVEEKISPWPSIRTVKTGWFYAGKAGDYISGGEAKVASEVWKVDARALSEAHLRR